MSNLRAGTPSRDRRRGKKPLNIYAVLAAMLLAAMLIGLVIGFGLGRSSASKPTPTPAASSSAEASAEPDTSASADASAAASTSTGDTSVQTAPAVTPDPTPAAAEPTGITVCIDPGHGGNDGGTSDGDRLEKNDNLSIALMLKDKMEQNGIEVVMTRDSDVYVSLDDRCYKANNAGVDYLISLHRNAAGGVANGVEVWRSHVASEEAIYLAEQVHDGIVGVGVSRDRGIRIGSQSSENFDLQMYRNTTMPATLVELGFIEISEDNDLFDTNMEAYCDAMVQAVLNTYSQFHKN